MRNDLWQTLSLEKSAEAAGAVLSAFPPVAAVIGLDNRPEARTLPFRFAEGGVLYFSAEKCSRLYAELSRKPALSLISRDPGGGSELRIGAKACFTEDPEARARLFRDCPELAEAWGPDGKMIALFFLTEVSVELTVDGDVRSFRLPDPQGVVRGVTIKKKTELRDRLAKILVRREEEGPAGDPETAKLYDGALFLFAEQAKALWPRMDVTPIERCAVFETWDEREHYTEAAKILIGNAVVDKPEDLTYWLNPETLAELSRERT